MSVGVIFTGNPSENEEAALTAALFEMVKTHCPKPGDTIDLCDEDGLPDSLWRVFIRNWGDLLKEQCWEYIEAGGVKTDFSAQLQRTIDQKGKKIANYRRFCERCWLIIAARGDRPSSFYEFDVDMTTTG